MRVWAAPVSRIALRAALRRVVTAELGNDSALPNCVDQLILADDPATVSDEMDKEVENLWFERDQIAGVTQFAPFDIEYVVTERECHRSSFNRSPRVS